MPNGRRWNVSYPRRFTAVILGACAVFTMCAGVGLANWAVVALGVALLILAVTVVVVAVVRGNIRDFVRGTAHVLDVTEPPASVSIGRCELQIVVEAPGLAPAKVKVRDSRVPVGKWPDIGATLPIRVAIDDPRHVRVLWDEVRSHGEVAADEERFNEYVQRIVDAELGPDDEPDNGRDEEPYQGPMSEAAPISPAGRTAAATAPAQEPSPAGSPAGGRMTATTATAGPALQEPPAGEPVTPRRPSPRRRRSATGSANGETARATAPATAPQPDVTHPQDVMHRPGTDLAVPVERLPAQRTPAQRTPAAVTTSAEEDVLVIDIAPIEGGPSAVLGVRPAPPSTAHETTATRETTTTHETHDPPGTATAAETVTTTSTSGSTGSPVGAIHGVGVTLIVTDLARSIDFYRDLLGFTVVDSGAASAVLASGETRIMLRRVSDMAPVDRRLVHLNLEVTDLPAVYDDLRGRGVKFLHRPRPVAKGEQMELWAAAFRDPDGHGISIIQWRPRTI
ncbi:MAG TPA: VOC family protein [Micromonosporaceae bacterium]|nr:VOC family protein [Micromonosporaceae bacterium]